MKDSSSRGWADVVVLHGGQVFVFEFKMVDGEGGMIRRAKFIVQIRDLGYADQYQERFAPVHLVGEAFNR